MTSPDTGQPVASSAPRQVITNVVGEVLSRIPQVVAEGLFARKLGPSPYGSWKALQLVVNLSGFLNFGLPAGLGKELPRALGRDDDQASEAMQRTSLTNLLATLAFLFAVLALVSHWPRGLAFLDLSSDSGLLQLDIVAIAGMQAMGLYQVFLRARLRFTEVAISTVLFASVFLAAGYAACGVYGVHGIVFSYGGGALLAALYCQIRLEKVVVPGWNREAWLLLARAGLPLIGYGALQWLFSYVDRVLVLSLYSTRELGLYGFAALAPYALSGISGSVTRAVLPIVMRRLGRDGQIENSTRLLLGTLLVMALFNALAIGALLPALVVATTVYWPTYATASPLAWLLLAGSYFFTIAMLMVPYAIAGERQWAMNGWAAVSVAVNALVAIALVRAGWGLQGVATATLVAQGCFCVALYRDVARTIKLETSLIVRTFLLALLPGAVVASMWFIGGRWPGWAVLSGGRGPAVLAGSLWTFAHVAALAPVALLLYRWLRRLFQTTANH